MGTDLHARARLLRNLVEPIAAGVYFAPEAQQRYGDLGLNYFEGYFCSRSACLGKAPWSVVCAAFGAFKPAVVEQAVTGGWSKTDPEPLLDARLAGADEQLQRLLGEPGQEVKEATEILFSLTDGVDPSGRMLYSGLSVLPAPDTPMGLLWRAADLVREHRGDGHIAAWISRTDSCEITVMTELSWGLPPGAYVFTRGWSPEEVDAARERFASEDCSTATTSSPRRVGRSARRSSTTPISPSATSSTGSATAPMSCSRCSSRWPRRSSTAAATRSTSPSCAAHADRANARSPKLQPWRASCGMSDRSYGVRCWLRRSRDGMTRAAPRLKLPTG